MSFGYGVSVMILLRILILSKIIALISYLKLTIKTNKPHYIYNESVIIVVTQSLVVCLKCAPSALRPDGPRALGVHRQTSCACVKTIIIVVLIDFNSAVKTS